MKTLNFINKVEFRKTKLYFFLFRYSAIWHKYFEVKRSKFGYCAKDAKFVYPIMIQGIKNVFLYENTNISSNSIIQTTRSKFIMKKNSGAAEGFTAITGDHLSKVGFWFKSTIEKEPTEDFHKDIIVEEDVWIATNVTLLKGVIIGRGSIVGSGSVCRKSVPPYAIVFGNPAKIVGFKFTPEEIIEHEKKLYPEKERLPLELLNKNHNQYFSKRNKDIIQYLK